ncbi:MAG: hypothetical protein HDS89_06560 [Bacteroidales bacterium]|nr:hypothetical protein [Bacteroidales bacterium]
MKEVLWMIFGWICKGFCLMMMISLVLFFVCFFRSLVTNGGRKWYYYNPDKPWKGGYWTPLLPDYPPYNEYNWNPDTCRFEHKKTGKPLHPWEEPIATERKSDPQKQEWDWDALGIPEDKPIILQPRIQKKRPE